MKKPYKGILAVYLQLSDADMLDVSSDGAEFDASELWEDDL